MIRIQDINQSTRKVNCDTAEEARNIYDYFSLKLNNIEHTPLYKMGHIDGFHHFINGRGEFAFGLKDKIVDYCINNELEYIDETKDIKSNITIEEVNDFINKLDLKFTPYKHQIDGVYTALKEKRSILLINTGGGKSLVAYILARYCIANNLKFLVIVPSVDLTSQLFGDFIDYFYGKEKDILNDIEKYKKLHDDLGCASSTALLNKIYKNRKELNCEVIEDNVHIIKGGTEKVTDKLIRISTYQSLSVSADRINSDYFEDVDFLTIDECLHPDTLILLDKDVKKKIKDIQIGDMVLTINEETKEVEVDEVVKVHKNISNEQMYEIELEDSTIVNITGNHKVQTSNRGWIRVDELNSNDDIIIKDNLSKIKNIKRIDYDGDTYNLHIKHNHNYFANNINVSNCHKASSDSISDIIKYSVNTTYRCGMSGSLGADVVDNLKIEGSIGKVNKILTMRQAIDLGIATEIIINPIYLQYQSNICADIKKMKWNEEDKYIRTLEERCKFIAKLALQFPNENVMIIYKNIDSANIILEEMIKLKDPERVFKAKDYQKENDLKIYYSKGDTKSSNRNDFRQLLEDSTGNILLGTSSIVSTGINIKNLHVLIFSSIGKSLTLVQQALGRVGRLHESKAQAIVYDIVDNATHITKTRREYPNYLMKHWYERLDVYTRYEYIVNEPVKVSLKLNNDII